jgi:predicted nuclease of restriction endonuclease-like (RecB) superfamily
MTKSRNKPAARSPGPRTKLPAPVAARDRLLNDVRTLIEAAREHVARAVNSALVGLYWHIGKRIREDVLKGERAEYGQQIVSALSSQLTLEYGRGFSRQSLFRMVRFAEAYANEQIVSSLMRQLSWTHFIYIIPIEDPLKRDFYAEMCRMERWSVRTLQAKINGLLYERTAISKKPDNVIRKELEALRDTDQLTPDMVFRDPYFLDFLGLTNARDEKDIEGAILRELEAFILELGSDFAFVARQKRMTVDAEDYYLDLLFYHRRLRRLVAIDLKLGRFQAADKGQMELYLRWLEAHDMQPGEEPPIGLILCAGKSDDHVTLLRLDHGAIRIAQYLMELPPRVLLEKKLHAAVQRAREKLARNSAPASNNKTRLPRGE